MSFNITEDDDDDGVDEGLEKAKFVLEKIIGGEESAANQLAEDMNKAHMLAHKGGESFSARLKKVLKQKFVTGEKSDEPEDYGTFDKVGLLSLMYHSCIMHVPFIHDACIIHVSVMYHPCVIRVLLI